MLTHSRSNLQSKAASQQKMAEESQSMLHSTNSRRGDRRDGDCVHTRAHTHTRTHTHTLSRQTDGAHSVPEGGVPAAHVQQSAHHVRYEPRLYGRERSHNFSVSLRLVFTRHDLPSILSTAVIHMHII